MAPAPVGRDRPAPRWQLALLLVSVALVLLSAFPYFETIRNANETPRLIQAMALVETGEWAIDGASRRRMPLGPDIARSPEDDRLYPNKPPGASLVGALGFVIAKAGSEPPSLREFTWWARLLAGIVPTLLIVAVAWGRLRELGYGAAVSVAVMLAWVFGTPIFSYARLFYGHALAAALLYLGIVTLLRGLERGSKWMLALGGVLASSTIAVEYGAAFAGLPIAVVLLVPVVRSGATTSARRRALSRAAIALAGALVPVVLLAIYHQAVFGSPLSTGYHHAADPTFAELHGRGLLGLGLPRGDKLVIDLFSPKTGLLYWSPLVLFGVAGLVRATRYSGPRQQAARLHLAVFVVVLVFGLGLSFEGGWRIGPRYLVVALPCLLLGMAEALEAWRERMAVMGLWGFALVWSLLANSLAATAWPHIDPTNIGEPVGEVFLALLRDGRGPYGLPQWLSPSIGMGVAVAIPCVLGLIATFWVVLQRQAFVALPLVLGGFGGALLVLVILPRVIPAHEKSERNLKYIESVYEPRLHEVDGRWEPVEGTTRKLLPLSAEPR